MQIRFQSFKLLLLSLLVLLVSCSKELSYEIGNEPQPTNTSEGTLAGAPGACANLTIEGVYGQALALDTTNKVLAEINFTTPGTYIVYTDTVNGMYFRGTGSVGATGVSAVTLQGFGDPLNPGQFTFTITFKNSTCNFQVDVYQLAPATSGDYFPTTANSWWTYISNAPTAGPADTMLTISTGQTGGLPGGNSYNLFTNEVATYKDSSLYRKASGQYFEYGDVDVLGIADNPVLGEWMFLADNVAAGTQWTSSEYPITLATVPVKLRQKYMINSKGSNELIDNLIYRNVITVNVTPQVQATTGGAWTDVTTYQTWFAKGIGLVNVLAADPIYGYRILKYKVN